ncbi:MAG: flagellar export protein FliJ [Gammaproteobacteria bacterium]
MKKSKRFEPLARIAANKEMHSAKKLGDANNNLALQKKKLSDLIQYREEYIISFKQQGEKGMDGAQLQTYQKFLVNIDNAIAQQTNLISSAESTCDQQKSSWRQQHTKTKIMDNVIDNYKKDEEHHQNKQEQKESDERNSRAHSNTDK